MRAGCPHLDGDAAADAEAAAEAWDCSSDAAAGDGGAQSARAVGVERTQHRSVHSKQLADICMQHEIDVAWFRRQMLACLQPSLPDLPV